MIGIDVLIDVQSDDKHDSRRGDPVARGLAASYSFNKAPVMHMHCAVDVDAAGAAVAIRRSKSAFETLFRAAISNSDTRKAKTLRAIAEQRASSLS